MGTVSAYDNVIYVPWCFLQNREDRVPVYYHGTPSLRFLLLS